jgi:hypothetical protein
MNKFLLALSVSALLAAPAVAGRLDVDPQILQSPQTRSQSVQPGTDYTATRSIQSTNPTVRSGATDPTGLGISEKQRGNQGDFFGANGR